MKGFWFFGGILGVSAYSRFSRRAALRRRFAVAVLCAFVMQVCPVGWGGLAGVSPAAAWDGSVADPYWNEAEQQYEIATAAQLAGMARWINDTNLTASNDCTYVLTADIDLGGTPVTQWTPIGLGTDNSALLRTPSRARSTARGTRCPGCGS